MTNETRPSSAGRAATASTDPGLNSSSSKPIGGPAIPFDSLSIIDDKVSFMQIGSSNARSALVASITHGAGSLRAPVTKTESFADALTASSPTGSTRGPSASDGPARSKLSHLTDSDRSLVNSAFGTTLTANGTDIQGRKLAPIAAWRIAADRGSGRLPAGQPITTDYLAELRDSYNAGSAGSGDMTEQYDKLLAAFDHSSSRRPVDTRM